MNGYRCKNDYYDNLGPRRLSPRELERKRSDEARQRNDESEATRRDILRHRELFGD